MKKQSDNSLGLALDSSFEESSECDSAHHVIELKRRLK